MDEHQHLNSIVNQLVGSSDPAVVKRLYAQWAATYDADLDSFGYVAPRIGVAHLARCLPDRKSKIHDAGCGTGLVGSLLSQLGYRNLHGSDFSASMLEKARSTDHYQDLQTLDFSEPLAVDSDVYDAVISIGVYTKRFKQHFIAEMLRITKPSGHFVFSCRESYFDEVMDTVSTLLKSKLAKQVSLHFDDYMTGQDASAYYIDIEKAAS